MKTNKVIVITKEFAHTVHFDREWNFTEETFIDLAQKSAAFKNHKVISVLDGNTHHICKYCDRVTKGADEDILCPECRELFGHAFYSEL